MKTFNQVITVEVSVDSIAQSLLATFSADFKHREMLTETIIGTALNASNIGYIYNALNGYTADVDFAVGDKVYSKNKAYGYVLEDDVLKEKYLEQGNAEVIAIDLYRKDKLKIKYEHMNSKGEFKESTDWVSHTDCNKLAQDL